MRISELLEAVAPIGTTTDQVTSNGLPQTTIPTGQPTPAGQTPTPAGQTPPTLGNQQPSGQQPPAAVQQGMQTTMTDLDKIAAQIVGLKQKQQQMQQQMQQQVRI